MKTLNIIQTVAKIAKIVCKVGYICCIVGGIFCIVGTFSLAYIPDGFKLGGVTIQSMIERSEDINTDTVFVEMAAGIIFCAAHAVLLKIADRYLKNELDAGTPFTFDGANEMLRLGIYALCIPVGTMAAERIVFEIMKRFLTDAQNPSLDNSVSVCLGAVIMGVSLLCRYGAEIIENQTQNDAENTEA